MNVLRTILSSGAGLVFPPTCALCRSSCAPGEGGSTPLCESCRTDWKAAERMPGCPRCAGTIGPHELSGGLCAACRRDLPRLSGTARIGAYQGRLADALRQYKYDGREDLHPLLANGLIAAVRAAPWLPRVELITFVPTHWRRQMMKPFYTAGRLAQALATALNLPVANLLRRTRAGRHQIGLSPTARKANVHGAFAVIKGVELRKARLLLVDDVKTTGATMEECAKVLRMAGAEEVFGAVIARVEWTPATEYYLNHI